ncbi:MAG: hypothetical protein GVX78_02520 [Bacteroidetes bacterium]|jgi:hypothetical protein|nr:hypothetical protein [Bacteroidota bacterium]
MKSTTIKNILIGLGLAFITIIIHLMLSERRGLELSSFLLVLIASIYYGFAFLSRHKKAMVIEIVVASVFVIMGISGLWFTPWILILGLVLHGLWDIAHHNNSIKLAEIPKWYVPFCATYDWVIAIYLSFIYVN